MPTSSHAFRFDPVTPVHKAMRRFMFDVLTQVGALDSSDIFEVDRCAREVARLVGVLPETGAALTPLLVDLRQRDATARKTAASTLYSELTKLVCAQLTSQIELEREHASRVQDVDSEGELRETRRRQLAAMSEQELAEALRWMSGALTPQELAAFVDDLQASVDAQTFGCLLDSLRRQTAGSRWQRLMRELGLPDPGAVGTSASASAGRDAVGPYPARRACRADRYRLLTQ